MLLLFHLLRRRQTTLGRSSINCTFVLFAYSHTPRTREHTIKYAIYRYYNIYLSKPKTSLLFSGRIDFLKLLDRNVRHYSRVHSRTQLGRSYEVELRTTHRHIFYALVGADTNYNTCIYIIYMTRIQWARIRFIHLGRAWVYIHIYIYIENVCYFCTTTTANSVRRITEIYYQKKK